MAGHQPHTLDCRSSILRSATRVHTTEWDPPLKRITASVLGVLAEGPNESGGANWRSRLYKFK